MYSSITSFAVDGELEKDQLSVNETNSCNGSSNSLEFGGRPKLNWWPVNSIELAGSDAESDYGGAEALRRTRMCIARQVD